MNFYQKTTKSAKKVTFSLFKDLRDLKELRDIKVPKDFPEKFAIPLFCTIFAMQTAEKRGAFAAKTNLRICNKRQIQGC